MVEVAARVPMFYCAMGAGHQRNIQVVYHQDQQVFFHVNIARKLSCKPKVVRGQ